MTSTQPFRFLAAGGVAALANIVSRALFSEWMSLPVAVTIAYGVGMAVAFVLMRQYVFAPGRFPVHRQIAVFVVVNLAAVAQTLLITLLLAGVVFPRVGVDRSADLLAHIIGVCVPIFTSFVAHKRWSFR